MSGSGGDQLSSRDTREDSSKRDGSAASSGTWGRNTVNSGVGSEGVYASGCGGGGRVNESVGGGLLGSEADGGVANASALPVSAVAMGLAPERSGEGTPSGADIAMDALAEEEVAHMAQRFFEQQQLPPKH